MEEKRAFCLKYFYGLHEQELGNSDIKAATKLKCDFFSLYSLNAVLYTEVNKKAVVLHVYHALL